MQRFVTTVNKQRWAILLGALLTALCSGCGSGSSGPKLPTYKEDAVPVSGSVTMDGEPLSDASVTFLFDGKAPTGFTSGMGTTDSSGKFALTSGTKPGVPAGRYKVVISKYATKDGQPFREDPQSGVDLEQARMSGAVREGVPKKYSDVEKTTLSAQVTTSQKDPVNFALKSK